MGCPFEGAGTEAPCRRWAFRDLPPERPPSSRIPLVRWNHHIETKLNLQALRILVVVK